VETLGARTILAAVLNVSLDHLMPKGGMPAMLSMLVMGLDRNAPMDSWIPELCTDFSILRWVGLAVDIRGAP